ncbi:pyridoxamine 5'-phosphate oxidase family protein [Mariniflexile sp. AS56]|uniref:pyridoxamine 5'-phosphate oxidase family protein n=1 Tax=Mariniflexile sp. AS56 TaxID=3063957 RepID=UPI0026F10E12|nr:pyridoxamine 5'-phosphate oxidase family protein [Mariniflexile sp. AS56]MDO7171111.1 pyridoxamine 5'-phosphate oxidase family protein [Mariniflexile sp. AS56]
MIQNIEEKEMRFILENNYVGQLGYVYQNRPFVVPITYYFDKERNAVICYSGDGHKMKAMRKNKDVCLQISDINTVNDWKSVLVHGKFEQQFGSNAKACLHQFSLGVKDLIMEKEKAVLDFIHEFSSKVSDEGHAVVFLIEIEEMTGKKRNT